MPIFYSCDNSSICRQEQQSTLIECVTCSIHVEYVYDTKIISLPLVLSPHFLGEIFYSLINIQEKNVIFQLERPPTYLS